jgi:polysaccharide chain length determinant protein (PEP-CTERM system associated)
MIENRDLTIDDYLSMLRRRVKLILIPTLLAPIVGFVVSLFVPAKYTSTALVLVEAQQVPTGVVQSIVTEDLGQRVATMQQQVLGVNRLRPMVDRLGLARGGKSVDEVIDDIRASMQVQAVLTDLSQIANADGSKRKPGQATSVPGFTVSVTWSNAKEAQTICNELTSMLLTENQTSRERAAVGTTDFISRQLEEAKHNLDDQDAKMAVFKRQYAGQLPGDEDNNLKLLGTLNAQLDANTQNINRAQQDKSYTESLLSQQIATWKSSQGTTNPQSLQQQLTTRQAQLLDLQGKYTADHPDVMKAKADIAELKKKLAEANSPAPDSTDNTDKGNLAEPPEIRQLRLQVHQYSEMLGQATREQKRLADQIKLYESRVAISPDVEEKYKQLTRDYDTAQKFYADLLAKRSTSEMATDMERRQQGEQMRLSIPANLPDSPSFPNRFAFAGAGLGAGLVLGLALALWLELRDKSIRTEADVEASLQMPVLVSLPWITADDLKNGNGGFWNKTKTEPSTNDKVEV